MKRSNFYHKSLAKQFSVLTFTIISLFSLLICLLLIYQHVISIKHERITETIQQKEKLAAELDYSFNLAISEMRAYLAFGGKQSYYYNMEYERSIVEKKLAALQVKAVNENDVLFLEHTQEFYTFYFTETVPKAKAYYDQGDFAAVTNIAVAQNTSDRIRGFQHSVREYTDKLNADERMIHDHYNREVVFSQTLVVIVLFLMIVGMVVFIRLMLRRIERPLKKLTVAAGDIADGKTVIFADTTNREDELGLFSRAFEKMTVSIYEKEQDLSAQNEELIAQQEELQTQQAILEDTLETMRDRERDLKARNSLINGIVNTIDKKQVLSSIIESMCEITESDKGLIVLLDDGDDASFGVSRQGVEQFKKHLHNGCIERILKTEKPYSVKRESTDDEKAFHTLPSYSYDLFLPVWSPAKTVEAMMAFTRYDRPFDEKEMSELDSLSKQIAISLDKIKLLQQSEEERLLKQSILDTIKEGIQLVDTNGKVIQVNKTLCEMLQCDWNTCIDKEYSEWVNDLAQTVENKQEIRGFFDAVIVNGQSEQSSFIYHQNSPVKRVVGMYCEPLMKDNKKYGTVIVHQDITKEYEVDRMKTEFVSTVSHELRTPLASVLGFTELMLHKDLPLERQKKYLTTIYQEANRLTSLINDFLDVQRLESGKQAYEKKYEDIVPLLRTIMDTNELKKHTFRLEVNTPNTYALGDKNKLYQVFNNLIGNAIKYSPKGGNITIKLFEHNDSINVSVSDEGIGIPQEALNKLFTKFYRVDNSDLRQIGGTGLGLAIVKEIVSAHKGKITVTSQLGKGSTFTVSFPLIKEFNTPCNEQLAVNSNIKVNVIIVEDDCSLANLLKTELEESQLTVQMYANGTKAVAAIEHEHPDAVVLDMMLEEDGLSGWDVIEYMKDHAELKHIPIFISTALEEKERGFALGATDYLIKPYHPSTLSKVIFQTLMKKDANGEIHFPYAHKGEK